VPDAGPVRGLARPEVDGLPAGSPAAPASDALGLAPRCPNSTPRGATSRERPHDRCQKAGCEHHQPPRRGHRYGADAGTGDAGGSNGAIVVRETRDAGVLHFLAVGIRAADAGIARSGLTDTGVAGLGPVAEAAIAAVCVRQAGETDVAALFAVGIGSDRTGIAGTRQADTGGAGLGSVAEAAVAAMVVDHAARGARNVASRS
jgi:hypothetical protein